MKRRALLVGALLMPTAARAKTTKQVTKKPAVPKPPPQLPSGPQPLKLAKIALVAFNASVFPYRSVIPDTDKPFLDARAGRKRGHTSANGDVYWEEPTYSDRRSLLYLPAGYDPQRPSLLVLFLHGQGATLERDVIARQGVPRQLAESGQNVALVAPQLAVDAADSSAGNFWKPGHFAAYIDEAAERLMRLYGDRRVGSHFNQAPVVVVAYSGGYLSAAYALERGGADHRIKGVILMDALYGDEDKFASWVAPPAGVPAERLHRVHEGRECDAREPFGQAARALHQGPAIGVESGNSRFRAVRQSRHAWRFCYTRVATRSPETCAGNDSRLRRGSC